MCTLFLEHVIVDFISGGVQLSVIYVTNWRQCLLVLLDIIPEFGQHHNLSIHNVIFHQLMKAFFAEFYPSAIGQPCQQRNLSFSSPDTVV